MRNVSRPIETIDTPDTFDISRVLERVRMPSRLPSRRPSLIVDNEAAKKDQVEEQVSEADEREVAPADTEAREWPLAGFAPMSRITTNFGEVPAVALRKGDLVRTADGKLRPIVWLDRVILDDRFLAGVPDANPVRISADAFGRGLPRTDIMVSPRQTFARNAKININSDVEAAALLSRPGVVRQPETGLSYTMFHLGEPAEVICEGMVVRVEP